MSKILVVDDNKASLMIMKKFLEQSGHEVLCCSDGLAALQIVEEHQDDLPALALLDIRMPGMDGFELFEIIKKQPQLEKMQVIFITGSTDWKDKARGIHMGAVDFIVKPFEAEELQQRVAIHLELAFYRDMSRELVPLREWLAAQHIDGASENLAHFDEILARISTQGQHFMQATHDMVARLQPKEDA